MRIQPLVLMTIAVQVSGVVTLIATTTSGCAPKARTAPYQVGNVDSGPGTIEAARKYLEGRWSLVSYEVFPPGASAIQLTGGSGSLSYDAYGNLDMQIRVSDPDVSDRLERAGIPLKQGVISTTGRAVIDMQGHSLVYILEGQGPLLETGPKDPLALSRPRYWQTDGKTLTLTTKGDDGQPLASSRWQKQ